MLKAVFFDFDGVIVDSEKLHSQSSIDFFAQEGIAMPKTEIYSMIGGNARMNTWAKIYERHQELFPYDYTTFRQRMKDFKQYLHSYDYSQLMFEDVPAILHELKENGYLLALASSSAMAYLERNLSSCGIRECFDYVISGDSLTESKPNPMIYLKCLEHFGLSADECVVVEDSTFGIEAGKSAGITVIALHDTRFGIDQHQADYLAASWSEVKALITKLSSSKTYQA